MIFRKIHFETLSNAFHIEIVNVVELFISVWENWIIHMFKRDVHFYAFCEIHFSIILFRIYSSR